MPPIENQTAPAENITPQHGNFPPLIPSVDTSFLRKPSKNDAFLFTIVFLLILTGIFGVWFFSHPLPDDDMGSTTVATTTDQFAGWQTYTNNQYGFEVKYPQGWQLHESLLDTTGKSSASPFIVIGNPLNGKQVYDFYIFIYQNPKNFSSENYVRNLLANAPTDGPGGIRYGGELAMIVGGEAAYELNNVFEYDKNSEQIYTAKGSLVYETDFPVADENPNLSNPKENNAVSHQILSTFKFISTSTPVVDTSGWKTYADTQYNFSFGYPSDWHYKSINRSDTGVPSIAFFPQGKDPDLQDGYAGDIFVDIIDNPNLLDLKNFYKSQDVNLFEESSSQIPLQINGHSAEKFVGVYGENWDNTISIRKNNVIIEFDDPYNAYDKNGVLDSMANSLK